MAKKSHFHHGYPTRCSWENLIFVTTSGNLSFIGYGNHTKFGFTHIFTEYNRLGKIQICANVETRSSLKGLNALYISIHSRFP